LKNKERERLKVVVFEAYMAGQARGQKTEVILDALSKKFGRTPRQLQNWIYAVNKNRNEESYKETPHNLRIRKLARALVNRISVPSLWDKVLRRDLPVDFQQGTYYLPIGAVEIGEDKQIMVNYYDVSANFRESHLIKGLFSHLSTSGLPKFSELVGDKGKLNNLVVKAGKYSQNLLEFLKLMTDEVGGYRTKVNFHDELKPGITRWFIVTAWEDALHRADGGHWIDNSWYKQPESIPDSGLLKLNCGAYTIGIAKSEKTISTYENWHKKLRDKYAKDPLAIEISNKQNELNNAADKIKQLLQEFSDTERLLGRCELC
jgi:hypothetical protein